MSEDRKDVAAPEQDVAYDKQQAAADVKEFADASPTTDVAGPVRKREDLHPAWHWITWSFAVSMGLFHLWTAYSGTLPTLRQGGIHLAFGLGLVFLMYLPRRRKEAGRLNLKMRGAIPPLDSLYNKLGYQRANGIFVTAIGMGVIAYLGSAAGASTIILVPSIVVLILLQITRFVNVSLGGMPLADVLLAAGGVWAAMWVVNNASDFNRYVGGNFPVEGVLAATIGTILVLVAAQRAVGTALTVIALSMFCFMLYGREMPGFLQNAGFGPETIVTGSFLSTSGIFGTPIQVSSTFIFLFMIFAALLQRTGMERFFTNLALGLAGRQIGATGKVSIITSAFSGTITGSSVANTVSNGAFTIPMMRRSGYSREFAGGVEAASSTGGQIAPPVMGAAAFIMLEIIGGGIVYFDILKAALIPAILFFTAQFIIVHFQSKRFGIMGLPADALPRLWPLLVRRGYLLIPLIAIILILSSGRTPMFAAFWAIIVTIGLNLLVQAMYLAFKGIQGWKEMPDKLTPMAFLNALYDATKMALPIVAACAAAGIISGAINVTALGLNIGREFIGLGETISSGFESAMPGFLAQHIDFNSVTLLTVMIFTMVACLIMGIGLPTTANYVVMAVVAAPAIVPLVTLRYDDMGLEVFQLAIIAHLFVYYFGVMADITPPVCLAAYAAAGISGGNPIMTGVQAVRVAISAFLVPFIFVFAPELLLMGDDWVRVGVVVITAIIGVTILGIAMAGWYYAKLSAVQRVLLFIAGMFLLTANYLITLIGIGLTIAVLFRQACVRYPSIGRLVGVKNSQESSESAKESAGA
ncbi:TRAP transporter permease [Natronoglycomyces albus]|uniref:TRAP transporter fused permease subunit n=1 Tax=Natronoglycomyces albus TaxID=2811108 RepID=A0A895XP43_9ACTN|nr:TRAP transporter fused permease subunit [Natronoglycomyces albus]QSB04276.1 TRAP transporter fused permease subunit [Natronoglycomyces albus]